MCPGSSPLSPVGQAGAGRKLTAFFGNPQTQVRTTTGKEALHGLPRIFLKAPADQKQLAWLPAKPYGYRRNLENE